MTNQRKTSDTVREKTVAQKISETGPSVPMATGPHFSLTNAATLTTGSTGTRPARVSSRPPKTVRDDSVAGFRHLLQGTVTAGPQAIVDLLAIVFSLLVADQVVTFLIPRVDYTNLSRQMIALVAAFAVVFPSFGLFHGFPVILPDILTTAPFCTSHQFAFFCW